MNFDGYPPCAGHSVDRVSRVCAVCVAALLGCITCHAYCVCAVNSMSSCFAADTISTRSANTRRLDAGGNAEQQKGVLNDTSSWQPAERGVYRETLEGLQHHSG